MIKFNSILYLLSLTLIVSCNSSTDSSQEVNTEDDTINYIQKEIDLNETDELEEKEEVELSVFKGNWFDISYPSNFNSRPTQPLVEAEDYSFIETDEAFFLSPDEQVEFFVYSPQWGGNPLNYLELAENEEPESEKTTVDEIDPSIISKWVTYKDKNDQYFRSYYSKETESTHLVFGIKYSDQASYDFYKEDYTAFKKSLIQYAD